MKIIKLTLGFSCIIDDDDFDLVSSSSWHSVITHNSVYAVAKRNKKHVSMHRLIMNAPNGLQVDHINGTHVGYILDNRKSNLRLVNHGLNKRNSFAAPRNSSSGHLGIRFRTERKRWVAMVYPGGRMKWIGSFVEKEHAVQALEKWKFENNYRNAISL